MVGFDKKIFEEQVALPEDSISAAIIDLPSMPISDFVREKKQTEIVCDSDQTWLPVASNSLRKVVVMYCAPLDSLPMRRASFFLRSESMAASTSSKMQMGA